MTSSISSPNGQGNAVQTSASCPAGSVMTGGGARVDGEQTNQAVVLNDDYPVGDNVQNPTTWQARAIQTANPGLTGGPTWTLVVSVICSPTS